MPHVFELVPYQSLNPRQQENYNFAKASALLADYGFVSMRLSDDWKGADFIAQHVDGETILRVQLKGRLTFNRKYEGKDLWIMFCSDGQWYMFPHDDLLTAMLAAGRMAGTTSWKEKGGYSFPYLGKDVLLLLEPYRLDGA